MKTNYPGSQQATAQVFIMAFRILPQAVKNQVVLSMMSDKRLREDFTDLAIAQERAEEPCRPFREFLSEAKRKHKL